jgi:cytochrome c
MRRSVRVIPNLKEDVMRRFLVVGLVLSLGLLMVGTAIADKAADTKALVAKGAAMVKSKGKAAALKAIGDPKGPFVVGDLYLFAGPLDKVTLSAHPFAAAKTVGKDLSKFKDPKGNLVFVMFKDLANKKGDGWVEYWWPKPGAKEPSLKRTYILRVPGENLYIGAGYYK